MENPFKITVYNKDFERLGWVDAPISQTWNVRHNQQSNGTIIVQSGSDFDKLLGVVGNRVVVEYNGEFLMSGPVRSVRNEGSGPTRLATYQVQDDFRLLHRLLLWPNPSNEVWKQTSLHQRYSGPAETVMRNFLANAVARLGEPVTVPTSLGRGDTISYNARFVTPADELLALVDQAGVGVRVRQSGAGLVVQFYEGETWPIVLSEDAGTLVSGAWSLNGPTCTRVVIGGAFEDTERDFFTIENPALEEDWGDVFETFVDGGSVSGDYTQAYESWRRAYERLLEEQADRAAVAKELRKAEQRVLNASQALARAIAHASDHPNSDKAADRRDALQQKYNDAVSDRNAAITALDNEGDDTTEAAIAEIDTRAELLAAYITYRDDIAELGVVELANGVAKSGLSMTLQEGEVFRYGGAEGFHVGDIVPVEVTPGNVITDVLRTVTLSLSSNGFTVNPQVGEKQGEPTSKLTKLIGSAFKNQIRMRTR